MLGMLEMVGAMKEARVVDTGGVGRRQLTGKKKQCVIVSVHFSILFGKQKVDLLAII